MFPALLYRRETLYRARINLQRSDTEAPRIGTSVASITFDIVTCSPCSPPARINFDEHGEEATTRWGRARLIPLHLRERAACFCSPVRLFVLDGGKQSFFVIEYADGRNQ